MEKNYDIYFFRFEEQIISRVITSRRLGPSSVARSRMQTTLGEEKRQTLCFEVTFYWLIGKLSLSSFIPASNF